MWSLGMPSGGSLLGVYPGICRFNPYPRNINSCAYFLRFFSLLRITGIGMCNTCSIVDKALSLCWSSKWEELHLDNLITSRK